MRLRQKKLRWTDPFVLMMTIREARWVETSVTLVRRGMMENA